MMAFFLFLTVLVINYNNGMARPTPDNDVQIVTRYGSDEGKNNEDRIFILPTVLKPGLKFNITGRLNLRDDVFQVVLHDKQDTDKDCTILYDYASKNIEVKFVNDIVTEPFELVDEQKQDIDFELKITVRKDRRVSLVLAVGVTGPSSALIFKMKNMEDIKSIEVLEGVTSIDSLSFTFS